MNATNDDGKHRVLSGHLHRVIDRGNQKADKRGRYTEAERQQNLDAFLRDLGGEA